MKQVFRRFLPIRCAYESIRCLDVEICRVLCPWTDRQTDCFTPAAEGTRGVKINVQELDPSELVKLYDVSLTKKYQLFSKHAVGHFSCVLAMNVDARLQHNHTVTKLFKPIPSTH